MPTGRSGCWLARWSSWKLWTRSVTKPCGRRSKKNGLTNRKIESWVIPPESDAEFAASMEELLETYEQPYDAARPVLCMVRRLGDSNTLRAEIVAWSANVNDTQRGVDWQMKIHDARCKLKSVYLTIKL